MVLDISELKEGHHKGILYNGTPIWIIHRTPAMITSIKKSTKSSKLLDENSTSSEQPNHSVNEFRSQVLKIFVVEGWCNHGDSLNTYMPTYTEKFKKQGIISPGFYCEDSNDNFDLSGRIYSGSKNKTNLTIPNYHIKDGKVYLYKYSNQILN